MTKVELSKLYQDVRSGIVPASEAIAILIVEQRCSEDFARELVFVALGGGDIIVEDAQGRRFFYHSGRPVNEVAALYER